MTLNTSVRQYIYHEGIDFLRRGSFVRRSSMYVRRLLVLFLSISVLSSPLPLLDDNQPQLGASLTSLGNSACPPLSGYGSLAFTNFTQAGNITMASQTTYNSATQTGISLAINSSASIVAPPSTVFPEEICTKIKAATLTKYKPQTYDFPPTLLTPADTRFFAFRFVRTGGQVLQIVITGRAPSSPDQPGSYKPLANEVFLQGDLDNQVQFRVFEPMWVKIRLGVSPGSGPLSYQLELYQIDVFA